MNENTVRDVPRLKNTGYESEPADCIRHNAEIPPCQTDIGHDDIQTGKEPHMSHLVDDTTAHKETASPAGQRDGQDEVQESSKTLSHIYEDTAEKPAGQMPEIYDVRDSTDLEVSSKLYQNSNETSTEKKESASTMYQAGTPREQHRAKGDGTGDIPAFIPGPTAKRTTGIQDTIESKTTDDCNATLDFNAEQHIEENDNSISAPENDVDHATGIEAEGDGINSPQQADKNKGDIGQRADKDEDTASLNHARKDNPTYVPGALRHRLPGNKDSAKICFTCASFSLVHGIIIAIASAAFFAAGIIVGISINRAPGNKAKFYQNVQAHFVAADGCPAGYKLVAARTCIRLLFPKVTYYNARKICKIDGANLAMPKTKELDLALRKHIRSEGLNLQYWIGLRDRGPYRPLRKAKRIWKWEDGTTLNYKTERKADRQGGRQTRRQTDWEADGHEGRQTDWEADRQEGRRIGTQTDREGDRKSQTDRNTDRQGGRQTGRQTDREADREGARQTGIHINKDANRQETKLTWWRTDRQGASQTGKQTDREPDRPNSRRIDRQQTVSQGGRQKGRQTDRKAGGQGTRQTGNQTDRKPKRQRVRQTRRQTIRMPD
uniref:C-type lectin domain-containing protein n=1 Tax=Branchiostoma floridae TaxID=7739 RepID=C3YFY2_BRAFL|eukprot:XP_002604777.1 hypothetical protein BRAFLDRAFT_70628 [Branchiostoma floridae]